MNVIGIVFLIAFVAALVYLVIVSAESALMSLIVKDENDYEALQFIVGCLSSKVSGSPTPDKPSYIGAENMTSGRNGRGGKRF